MASFAEALEADESWDEMRVDEAANIVAEWCLKADAGWNRYDDMVDLSHALSRATVTDDAAMSRPDKRTRAQTCGEASLPECRSECNHLDEGLPPVHASKIGSGNRARSVSMGVHLLEPPTALTQAPTCCHCNSMVELLADRTPEPENATSMDAASNRSTPTRQLAFQQP